MIKIELLTKKYLDQACKLGDSVFGYEEIQPSKEIGANLDSRRFKEFRTTYDNAISTESYIALKDEQVIGISGLYRHKEDAEDTLWLGWFCVNPRFQGKGVGGLLLDYTIEEARGKRAKYLRLYTSTRPEEKAAQGLYEKKGFKIMNREYKEDGQYRIFYREKVL